jgi:hypothetical protein
MMQKTWRDKLSCLFTDNSEIMHSKNSRAMTVAERAHLARVKSLPCAVCGQTGPSDAHHIKQGQHWTAVALCRDCHQGRCGWHGDKSLWRVYKMDEVDALAVTIRRLLDN